MARLGGNHYACSSCTSGNSTQASGVDHLKQHAVPLGRGGTDQEADLDLRHDALGQVGPAAAGVGARDRPPA